ncbi:type II toxin-antitoxin system PemK/MazF family toxin [Candidatus Woesearchaeota archaeon]|nr:type II toxin-antitoxin system PemK/MazF family toxin [Candidatus Woesearchaeota archaeon]
MEKIFVKQREIVLVPFPFSDQTGQKVRPALVLSNDVFNQTSDDVILCGLTTTIKQSKYTIIITPDDIEEGVLYEKSAIKVESILKIDKTLIIKSFARLNKETFSHVISTLSEIFKQ